MHYLIIISYFNTVSIFYIVPSGPPQNVTVINLSSRNFTLVWSPPLTEHQNGIIRYYLVDIASEDEEGGDFQMNSTGISLIIDGLHPFYTYSFSVSAVTVGPGPQSSVQSVVLLQEG